MDKYSATLIKKEVLHKVRSDSEEITTDSTKIKRFIRDYHEQL